MADIESLSQNAVLQLVEHATSEEIQQTVAQELEIERRRQYWIQIMTGQPND
jgi:hypothetical protein